MKNKKLLGLVFLLTFVITPLAVKADNENTGGDRERKEVGENISFDLRKLQLKQELNKNAIQEKRDRLQEARENYLNATDEERVALRKEFRNRFMERFVFSVNRLSEFQTRLDARLVKMTEEGFETSEAKTKLSEAKTKLSDAKADIEDLKTILSKDYTDEERDAKKEEVKLKVEEIKTGLKEAYQKTKEVFALMKDLLNKENEEDDNEEEAN